MGTDGWQHEEATRKRRPRVTKAQVRGWGIVAVILGLTAVLGCAAAGLLLAYSGGSLPPGEGDIGGLVLAAAPPGPVTTAQAPTPVAGAEVLLYRGVALKGRAVTGPEGYFNFERPDSGNYTLEIIPPEDSGLAAATVNIHHNVGQQTYVTIELSPIVK